MPNSVHVSPGDMTRRITIQKRTDTPDGAGGVTPTWTTFYACWAQILPLQGSEPYFSEQLYPKESYDITVRYKKGVVPGMRVLFGTHTFRIRSIYDTKLEHVTITMRCEELQVEGVVP